MDKLEKELRKFPLTAAMMFLDDRLKIIELCQASDKDKIDTLNSMKNRIDHLIERISK